jgi:hypothetical protein
MSDDKKDDKFKFEIFKNGESPFRNSDISEEEAAKQEKAYYKQCLSRKVKNLNPDSIWTVPQELLQEIHASCIISDPDGKLPSYKEQRKQLIELIKDNYKDDDEIRELLIESVPSHVSVGAWSKKKGWEEAVWSKIRAEGLFTKEKRVAMLEALYQQGVKGSYAAAKIWLTISGDYSDKMDVNTNNASEIFREINQTLRKEK